MLNKQLPSRTNLFFQMYSFVLLSLFSSAWTLSQTSTKAKTNEIAFTNVNVIPMNRNIVLRDMTVLVRGGKIKAVGRFGKIPISSGAQKIDARGKYLLPGLGDMHTHFSGNEPIDQALLNLHLVNGVTTVLSLGGSPEILRLRESIVSERFNGPNFYTAGSAVDDANLTREGGIRLVDEHRRLSYDVVKVYNRLSLEGYRGIMQRAKQINLPVVGHVVRAVGLEGTLGSGQHGIVHLEEYLYTYTPFRISNTTQIPSDVLKAESIPYLAQATAKADVWVTTTLVTFEWVLAQTENSEAAISRQEARYIPETLFQGMWSPKVNKYGRPLEQLGNVRAAMDFQRQMVKPFHDAGVNLLLGTDAPIPAVVPGFAAHEELLNLVEAGLTSYQALETATVNPARYLGKEKEFGTVEAGKRADMILLEANPIDDINNTRKLAGVMVRGRWFSKSELGRMISDLPLRDVKPAQK
jgi:imidazolonepropionase-like amidohydrolase